MYVTVFQMTSCHFNYSDVNDQRVIFLSHLMTGNLLGFVFPAKYIFFYLLSKLRSNK